ncbi:uncharacterized protein PG998_001409 [Apiospora kogelbergensis]|uniref:Uncharacterized protein n=1 Tax=Apiospora kogelbergensis TaxID=1337665 RepID=A0AAW0QQ01_9PEZI
MCDCKVKTYKYTACLHRSKTRVLCWKASWRTENFLCLGQVITKCKPKKEKRDRYGLCTKCTYRFFPYHVNDPKYVRNYLKWKEDNDYAGKRVDADIIPIEAVFTSANKRRKLAQQSPMVAVAPRQQPSFDSFNLAADGALSSDYTGSECSRNSPGPEDLSDLPGRLSLGPVSFRGRPHAGAKILTLYRHTGSRINNTQTKQTLLPPCNEENLQRQVTLNAAPKKPCWRKSETYFVMAVPSHASSTGYISHVRSPSHKSIPVPPPLPARDIFTSCTKHGQTGRLPNCADCTEAYFRERGVPVEAYIRECRSAPPCWFASVHRATATHASCQCDTYGSDNCLACIEKALESIKLQANFI